MNEAARTNEYEDMLFLPRHCSDSRAPMPRPDRAAQFAAFAALSGYGEAVDETARLTERRAELSDTEKERIDERQKNEAQRQQEAEREQAMMARLAALESPSIGTRDTVSTNQSREAKQVRLAGWMSLKR